MDSILRDLDLTEFQHLQENLINLVDKRLAVMGVNRMMLAMHWHILPPLFFYFPNRFIASQHLYSLYNTAINSHLRELYDTFQFLNHAMSDFQLQPHILKV